MRLAVLLVLALSLAGAVRVSGDASPSGAQRARVDAAARAWALAEADYEAGRATLDSVYLWSRRWLDAERDDKGRAPQSALTAHQQRMQSLESLIRARQAQSTATALDAAAAEFYARESETLR